MLATGSVTGVVHGGGANLPVVRGQNFPVDPVAGPVRVAARRQQGGQDQPPGKETGPEDPGRTQRACWQDSFHGQRPEMMAGRGGLASENFDIPEDLGLIEVGTRD
jgi:hypothetical protein